MVGGILHGTKVLDVAAGTGSLRLLAAEAGAQVVATDLSPGMVARLSERLAAYTGRTADALEAEMALAGFSNVTVRALDGAWTGESVDALVTDAKRISRFVPAQGYRKELQV